MLYKPGSLLNSIRNAFIGLLKSFHERKISRFEILCDDFLAENAFWVLLKCDKCNTKRIPMVNKGKILPVNRYCKNCGSDKFYLERKDDIERLDTIYALYSKDLINVRPAKIKFCTSPFRTASKTTPATEQVPNNLSIN